MGMTNINEEELDNEIVSMKTENGIVFIYFKVEKINLDIAKKLLLIRLEYTNKKDSIMFIDVTNVKEICKDSRDYFGSTEGTKHLIAVAMFTKSKLSVFLVNFLMNVNLVKNKMPIKLFSDKEKALLWLENFK